MKAPDVGLVWAWTLGVTEARRVRAKRERAGLNMKAGAALSGVQFDTAIYGVAPCSSQASCDKDNNVMNRSEEAACIVNPLPMRNQLEALRYRL
ncbi:MAG: hypothetical protein EOO88_38620 [Pedobacter sp.]|nr:MAG: hypothetical protein EOO88_38620 [Pedobacter sp.]